jgi:hypothetical protein
MNPELNHQPLCIFIINNIWNGISPGSGGRIQPPQPKIGIKIPKNPELSAMKDGLNLCKKGVHSDICFYLMLTPGKKLKDFIVYEFVWSKNLLHFLKFSLHLTETAPAKSRL